jgi:two-component system cell cycle sensor histidine kinase/response regulator CckA
MATGCRVMTADPVSEMGGASPADGSGAAVERMIQQALDRLRTGIFLLDGRRRFLFFNDVGRDLMPDPSAVAVGEDIFELNPPLKGHAFGDAILLAVEGRVMSSVTAYAARLDGWYEMSCVPVDGGAAVYCRNVTEEHERQEHLEQAGHRLKRKSALLDAASDAVYVRELDGTISYWNKGAERIYGWPESEALHRQAPELLYAEADLPAFWDAVVTVLDEGTWIGVLTPITRDGRTIQTHSRWQLATDDDGDPLFVLCMSSDVTEYNRKQDETYRVQRMESLGTLAGGIAHDLNNLLTPALIAIQLLQQDHRDDQDSALLESVETSITRGSSMIRQVLSFARGEEGVHAVVATPDLVTEVADFARDTLPKSIRVRVEPTTDLPPMMCDRTQILQVLVNLITNARDAMPDGGTVTITASTRPGPSLDGRTGDAVVIEVEDTGSGMDPGTASRIFEPFFSTKKHGSASGTGLGLSTSLAIARGHGGTLEVDSEPGRGSRFRLSLPAASGVPPTVQATGCAGEFTQYRGDGQSILVVDDDDAIRTLTRRTLEAHGYRTDAACNGREAALIVDGSPDQVDLVFTDMMMPVMDGPALIAHLHQHHPHIPLIAASGLAANVEVAGGNRHNVRFFLPKPFSAAELLQALHQVFHERASRTTRSAGVTGDRTDERDDGGGG